MTLLAVTLGPAPDGDGDGVLDRDDKCPADAETYNGYQDADGCPDLAPAAAGAADAGKIVERIAFAHDSAELKPVSSALLDAIAIVIKNQPQLFPIVALEGHAADNERSPMKLSLARASTVRLALLARGVDVARLLARASGTTAPVCTQANESCWARERTVEFVTLAAPKPAAVAEVERPSAGADPGAAKPAPDPAAAAIPLERIEFKKGSAVIGPGALANLDIVAGFMKATPASLEILGYAAGDERRGAALARARADAVRAYMLACGVSGQHLTVRAETPSGPRCRSRDDACHTRNRRADLRFVEPQAPGRAVGDAAPSPPPND
jgi:outer membrane protein OmpA-like peptidoglycan-associated protein